MSGVSQIIVDPSLFGEVIPTFPAFPTQNKAVFNFATSGANFTIPSGVTWIGAKIWGAGGRYGNPETGIGNFALGGNGSSGSYAQIILEVTPNEILQIRVGGGGIGGVAGINGGASGGVSVPNLAGQGGSSGGYSGIFINPNNPRPLVVIGGGGGGGGGNPNTGGSPIAGTNAPTSYGNIQNSSTFNGTPGGSTRGAGAGGGGAGGGISGNVCSGGGSGNPVALFRDVAIQTNSQLTNPTITPRKLQLVVSHIDGSSYTSIDPDFVAAGNNFCLGGIASTSQEPKNGLVILYWNNS
jgi:hypothetical protein